MPSSAYIRLKLSFVTSGVPEELADALLREYEEIKRRYSLSDFRPAAINGGRYCEAVTRILEYRATGTYTPLTASIKVDQVLNRLSSDTALTEGLRLHAIRAIRLVYGIRNQRDNGHLRDGIDPNLQDATVLVACSDWILAELVREMHSVTAEEAGSAISNIVRREIPLVEEIEGAPVVLSDLSRRDLTLALLYWNAGPSTSLDDLKKWLPLKIRRHLGEVLKGLARDHLVHLPSGDVVYLTQKGVREVEDRNLLAPL